MDPYMCLNVLKVKLNYTRARLPDNVPIKNTKNKQNFDKEDIT
jgi:hypothetical protein